MQIPRSRWLPWLRWLRWPVCLLALALGALVLLGAPRTQPARAAPAECTQDWRPAATAAYLDDDGSPTVPAASLPPPPSPAHRPHHVFCGGRYVNTVWLALPTPSWEAYRVAIELAARARFPSVAPAVNPTRGLTGLASWFWAVPDATPVMMRAGNGPAIDVELRVQTVRWRFADGAPTATGLGLPFPSASPVAHVFERKGSFTVEADVVLAGRVWGEELIVDLPPGRHTVTLRHDVAEVRSLLHAR